MNLSRGLLPIFVLAVAVYIQHFCETESANPPNKINKYCGRNLVNVLTMVCDGVYNHHMPEKDASDVMSKIPQLRSKRSVVTIFQRSEYPRRYKRGAYDECCRKGCSIDEMVGYCGSP